MAKNPMMKLLAAPDKGISRTHGPNGILARLFRTILYDEDITPFKYIELMDTFIRENQSGVPKNRVDLTSWRGNLTKELSHDRISWKVFCKALRFLRAMRVEFKVTIFWHDGHVSSHVAPVDFGSRDSKKALIDDENEKMDTSDPPELPLDLDDDM